VSLQRKTKPVATDMGRYVNTAGVGGKWLFLSGEVCSGVAAGGGDRFGCEVGVDWAEVSRGRSTSRDRQEGWEGLNVR
jgi:hypothetical protein